MPNLNNCVPHITSSMPQDKQIPANTEASVYATIQSKTKISSQPHDSEGSSQDTHCSSTTAQTSDEVDFIIGSSMHIPVQNALQESKMFERTMSSCWEDIVMQPELKQNALPPFQSTAQMASLKSSSSFCCNRSAMPMDSPRSEMIKSNSLVRIGEASLHNRIAFKPKPTKPLPPLPFKPPSTCTIVHKSLMSLTSPKGYQSFARSTSMHLFSSGILATLADQEYISMATEYEVPMRSNCFRRCSKDPSCAKMVPRSYSFSTNQDDHHVAVPFPPILSKVLATNQTTEALKRGNDATQCSGLGDQVSSSEINSELH